MLLGLLGGSIKLLFVVEGAFDIKGRGCVLLPGVSYAFSPRPTVGTPITITTPDGRCLDASIAGMEMFKRSGGNDAHAEADLRSALSIPGLTKDMVPVGSSVFLKEGVV